MSRETSFKSLTSTSSRPRATRRKPLTSRPRVEPLEDRSLPSFSMPVDYGSNLSPQAVVAADFDGNGGPDLAALDSINDTVSVLFSNGDGTFQAPRTSGAGIGVKGFVAGDLNGDGQADLVTLYEANWPSVLLANGDGTFAPPQVITLPAQIPPGNPALGGLYQTPDTVAVGDCNGDGKLDLVVGAETVAIISGPNDLIFYVDHYANALLGNGDGTLYLADVKHIPGRISPHPGDFNNDGRLDVLTGHGVLLGNGDGTFQDLLSGSGSVSDSMGDFNGDGNLDVVTGTETGTYLTIGNGDGTFRPSEPLGWIGYENRTTVGDVNGDGKLDIVVLANDYVFDEYANPITTTRLGWVLLGYGDGTFASAISDFGTVPNMSIFDSPALADFDGDGFPDLAAIEHHRETGYDPDIYQGVHVMLNDGGWTLPPPPPPSITIGNVTVTEGNMGTTAATFTVTLSKSWDQPVTVAYATAVGSATAGSDYQAASGTLTIPAGQTTGTVTVLVNGDRLAEPNETFFVNLSSPINATIADGQGAGTILDDEPRVGISDLTKAEGKNRQTTLFTFTVTLSAAYDQPVTVSYRTADGTAKAGEDYTVKTGTLTFAPGETTQTITISVIGDNRKEANESFFVDLFGNSSNSLFTKNRGVGTILNDD